MAPFTATIDPMVPQEWVLAIVDRQITKKGYADLRGFRLELRCAAIEMAACPLAVMMFGLFPPGAGRTDLRLCRP